MARVVAYIIAPNRPRVVYIMRTGQAFTFVFARRAVFFPIARVIAIKPEQAAFAASLVVRQCVAYVILFAACATVGP